MKIFTFQTHDGKFVTARDGVLYADSSFPGKPQERFRLQAPAQGSIALQAFDNRYVCALQGGGEALMADRKDVGEWERFRIEKADDGLFAVKTAANYYWSANAGVIKATAKTIGKHEKFRLDTVTLVNMRSHDKKWLSVVGENILANSSHRGPNEMFWMIDLGNGRIALQGHSGKFLCASNGGGGQLVVNRDEISDWETFVKVPVEGGLVALKSWTKTYYLGAGGGKVLISAQSIGIDEKLGLLPAEKLSAVSAGMEMAAETAAL
jgi:hypothetical protein